MGRLFSKFFLAFFIAQVLSVVGVGFMIWLAGPEPHLPEPDVEWRTDEGPPPPPGCPDPWVAAPAARSGGTAPAVTPGGAAPAVPPGGAPPAEPAERDCPPPFDHDVDHGHSAGPAAHPGHPRPHHGHWLERRRHGYPFIPVGVGLIASILFAFLLARHFAGPILALRSAFAELGRGNLKLRLGPGTAQHPDELESLRNDFDASAARLEVLVEGQRRLLHDMSHEVRSPVARLQLALDLIRQQPQRAEELLGRMEREVSRIDHLVEELLTLSRLEARAFGPMDQSVDLAELLHAIAEDAGFEGQARELKVSLECAQRLLVRGHAELLHRAIENVVRNALSHSPTGGTVRIQAQEALGNQPVRVVIEDEGAGVPASELDRMFQPFKRLQGSATGDGHGLGLAITREAVAAHGGRAYAENLAQGGLRVVLVLGS